ncbi:probable choline kinase 2 isoform X2 [Aristolochia californica]|uniref:probable choline kinase 2 isoform X2 n=1 Tax=Aristolochia californica TaxID=171875 RepID=UPI0035E33AB6
MVAVEIDKTNNDGNNNVIENSQCQLPIEAKRILHSLASNWNNVIDSKAIEVFQLKGAMTNQVYQITWPTDIGSQSRTVLVRIYGEGVEVFFDREVEIRTFECMSKHGQGPRLLGRFPSGRVEEFIHARTLSAADLHDIEISAVIAVKLREFHDLDMPGPKDAHLWQRLSWLKVAQQLCSLEEAKQFQLDTMEEEIDTLEKELSHDNQTIGFCHNDLQYGNIMIDEETRTVTIIDYEYATFNPVAYDIANHFCEMAADYHTETPHILDFSKYPDIEKRKQFVQKYLSSTGSEPSGDDVEQLLQDVEKYTLATHLTWCLWGIISEHVNEIDFDYMEYARQRFQQYWLKKPVILGSSD